MPALRAMAAWLLGLLGALLYITSLYSYYRLLTLPEGSGNVLGAALGFGIGVVAALAASILLALSALASGSRTYRLSLLLPWLLGVLVAAILSYSLSLTRGPGGLERGISEAFRPEVFIQALLLSGGPYTPLLLVSLFEALRRR